MGVEFLAPGGTGIGEEDVDVVGCFRHFCQQMFYSLDLGGVGRDGNGLGARSLVREGIESGAGFFAGFGLAGGDVDLGAAGLEEAGCNVSVMVLCSQLKYIKSLP